MAETPCRLFGKLPVDVMTRTDITASAKVVYAYLMFRGGNGSRTCRVGLGAIGKGSGLSRNSVRRALESLEQLGLIVAGRNGPLSRTENSYSLADLPTSAPRAKMDLPRAKMDLGWGQNGPSARAKMDLPTETEYKDSVKTADSNRQMERGATGDTSAVSSFGGSAGAAVGGPKGAALLEIAQLLADRGCDPSFREPILKLVDIRLIRTLAGKFDERRKRIRNPGGWWRTELRRAGVTGI